MQVTQFERLLRVLTDASVDFVLIGGVAAAAHGAARLTYDLDVVYSRRRENIHRLVSALAPLKPYLRGAPGGVPFQWDVETVEAGLNFTLVSTLSSIDVLGEVTGGGSYDDLLPYTQRVDYGDGTCLCVTLPKLIVLKRAAGRRRDNDALAELEVLLEEHRARNADG